MLGSLMLLMISLQAVIAQQIIPTTKANESLNRHFENASNINWMKSNAIYCATFSYQKESWIAFIDNDGNLVAKGRRISQSQLPLLVQSGLIPLKQSFEKKMGALSAGCIYEMVKSGTTEYFIPLENDNHYLALKSYSDGNIVVASKRKKSTTGYKLQDDPLAKK